MSRRESRRPQPPDRKESRVRPHLHPPRDGRRIPEPFSQSEACSEVSSAGAAWLPTVKVVSRARVSSRQALMEDKESSPRVRVRARANSLYEGISFAATLSHS